MTRMNTLLKILAMVLVGTFVHATVSFASDLGSFSTIQCQCVSPTACSFTNLLFDRSAGIFTIENATTSERLPLKGLWIGRTTMTGLALYSANSYYRGIQLVFAEVGRSYLIVNFNHKDEVTCVLN